MTKIDEKFNDFKIAIIAEIREQIKQEVSEALEKEIKKREELESSYRTMFYHSRKNLKRNVKVKLDLTKKRYSIFTEAMQLVKNNEVVKFVMADSNCCLKVAFKDGNSFFLVIVIISIFKFAYLTFDVNIIYFFTI